MTRVSATRPRTTETSARRFESRNASASGGYGRSGFSAAHCATCAPTTPPSPYLAAAYAEHARDSKTESNAARAAARTAGSGSRDAHRSSRAALFAKTSSEPFGVGRVASAAEGAGEPHPAADASPLVRAGVGVLVRGVGVLGVLGVLVHVRRGGVPLSFPPLLFV